MSGVLCHSSSVLLCMRGALESKSHQQLDRCMTATVFEQRDITVIVLCTIHLTPGCTKTTYTSAPEPGETD